MPTIKTFGIYDEDILALIADINDQLSKIENNTVTAQEVRDYFYGIGATKFHKAEVIEISNYRVAYLEVEEHNTYPDIAPNQVLGNKFVAFLALRQALILAFSDVHDVMERCFDKFLIESLLKHKLFYKIEAAVQSSIQEFYKTGNMSDETAYNNFIKHKFESYKTAYKDNEIVCAQIDVHLQYTLEVSKTATPSTRQRSLPSVNRALADGILKAPESSPRPGFFSRMGFGGLGSKLSRSGGNIPDSRSPAPSQRKLGLNGTTG
jgi:hypothetical protein